MSTDIPVAPTRNRLAEAVRLRRLIGQIPADQIRRTFSYDRRLLPNAFLAEKDRDITNVEGAASQTGISPGYPSWNLLYYTLLCSLSPDMTVVEIGTHRGFSTILLAQAIRDGGLGGRVHTVDIDPVLSGMARENVAQANLDDLVEFTVSDSVAFLRAFTSAVPRIDFAFVDGDHEAPTVLAEFQLLKPIVARSGGKIFFDNTATGGVAEVLEVIRREHGGNLIDFPNCSWGPHGNVIWQA